MSQVSSPLRASRAVLRRVEPGSSVDCASCGEQVKFAAKANRQQVIANVYIDGVWNRVEHYHSECYEAAGSPFGTPCDQQLQRGRRTG
jgi:hypothetical protein